MIAFYRLWDKMNRMGIRQKDLRDNKILTNNTINRMRNNETVTTESINRLCAFLKCQPEEIMEYVPDPPSAGPSEAADETGCPD